MRIPYRQQWLLRRTNRRLRRSDPHLAAMLGIFARLYAGEAIISREQAASPAARLWRRLIRLAVMVACTAAGVIACTRRTARRTARAWATICRQISKMTHTLLSPSPVAHPPVR
jgi:hypothetical protein